MQNDLWQKEFERPEKTEKETEEYYRRKFGKKQKSRSVSSTSSESDAKERKKKRLEDADARRARAAVREAECPWMQQRVCECIGACGSTTSAR